jgi:hypothetical protein
MMFEELQRLYEAFLIYLEGGTPGGGKRGNTYRAKQSKLQMDLWAEERSIKMESVSLKKDYAAIEEEINTVNGPKFYKKHLLNSIN